MLSSIITDKSIILLKDQIRSMITTAIMPIHFKSEVSGIYLADLVSSCGKV